MKMNHPMKKETKIKRSRKMVTKIKKRKEIIKIKMKKVMNKKKKKIKIIMIMKKGTKVVEALLDILKRIFQEKTWQKYID